MTSRFSQLGVVSLIVALPSVMIITIRPTTTNAVSVSTLKTENGDQQKPQTIRKKFSNYFKPITKEAIKPKASSKIIDLGCQLFSERALSPKRTRSSNDCHDLSKYGTNGTAAIKAREAGTLKRDVPSIYNIKSLKLMTWSGVTSDLRTHTEVALLSSAESAMPDRDAAVKRIETIGH